MRFCRVQGFSGFKVFGVQVFLGLGFFTVEGSLKFEPFQGLGFLRVQSVLGFKPFQASGFLRVQGFQAPFVDPVGCCGPVVLAVPPSPPWYLCCVGDSPPRPLWSLWFW